MTRLSLIWAQARNGVIGNDGTLPWHLPEDLAHFKSRTLGHPVIMGRHTWNSLDARVRPLPGRRNIVVTHNAGWAAPGAEIAHSVDEALALVADEPTVSVIGGAQVYAAFLPMADRLEVTEIDRDYPGDTVAPTVPMHFRIASTDPDEAWHTSRTALRYRFLSYERA